MGLEKETSLERLIQHIPVRERTKVGEGEITGISMDSREIESGHLFVASEGTQFDGHRYIEEAVHKGAVAVVGSKPADSYAKLTVPYFSVSDPRAAAAHLAAAFYGFPGRDMVVVGVTGTDGKTTTTHFIFNILKEAGHETGMISTVNAVIGDQTFETGFHVTTPDAPHVQRYLAQMVGAGLTHVVIEATSHGLAQKRVDACAFDVAVVTNITHEHLDYHGSYGSYRAAKARLLNLAAAAEPKPQLQTGYAVLNRDDDSFAYLFEKALGLNLKTITYGMGPEGDVRGRVVEHDASHLAFEIQGRDGGEVVETSLIGEYNVSNGLAAFAACREALGVKMGAVRRGIQNVPHIPGRMEAIDLGQAFTLIVDFAHTPNALRRALETVTSLAAGRVIAVFGSAGLRDKAKRRLMAEVSAELADLTVLTAEDPRTESLDAILEEMAAGLRSCGGEEGETFWRVPDRGRAIRFALDQARPDDLVIVCGKGHEQSMCFGETEYAWDDRVAARAALADYLGIAGPEMPYLPTRDKTSDKFGG
ncbi:MAG: UDP-N-acetylmuramoyl-L-alanyl-D-glutamate--2,6-diaminopimelate ligase [Anaerolineales bacterium]